MAALFYLPRLFVYHSTKEIGSDSSEKYQSYGVKTPEDHRQSITYLCLDDTVLLGYKGQGEMANSKNVSCHGHDTFSFIS